MASLTFDEDTAFVDGRQFAPCPFFGMARRLLPHDSAAGALPGIDHYGLASQALPCVWGKTLKSVMLFASAIGFLGMVAGSHISYYAETPVSASITTFL